MEDKDIERIESKVDTLNIKFDKFLDQYELDMRGNMNSSNGGSRGVIGEIRAIKQYQRDYPSITWLLKRKPMHTIATILAAFLFLLTLYQFGMMKFILAYFGVPIP